MGKICSVVQTSFAFLHSLIYRHPLYDKLIMRPVVHVEECLVILGVYMFHHFTKLHVMKKVGHMWMPCWKTMAKSSSSILVPCRHLMILPCYCIAGHHSQDNKFRLNHQQMLFNLIKWFSVQLDHYNPDLKFVTACYSHWYGVLCIHPPGQEVPGADIIDALQSNQGPGHRSSNDEAEKSWTQCSQHSADPRRDVRGPYLPRWILEGTIL